MSAHQQVGDLVSFTATASSVQSSAIPQKTQYLRVVAIDQDALEPGARVLLLDDLLATGGTAAAAVSLLEKIGAEIVEIGFLIELGFLNGREKMGDHPINSLITY